MIAALETRLREHWSLVGPGAPPRRLAFLKLGLEEYPAPEVPLLFLAFADAAAIPCAVAKVARDPAGDAAVEAEARALETLAHKLPQSMRSLVPRLVHADRLNGRAGLLMTALPGAVELHNTWDHERARSRSESILSALAWAVKLSQAVPAPALRLREWIDAEQLAAANDTALALGWKRERWAILEERLQNAWDVEWPTGFAHGDYFPGNLLFRQRALTGVVDWAMAAERRPLFFDVLTYEFSFCVHAARCGTGPNVSHLRTVHALPPFSAIRQRLRPLGITMDLGSVPRLATLLILSRAAQQCGRPTMAQAFLRILAAEVDALSAATAR